MGDEFRLSQLEGQMRSALGRIGALESRRAVDTGGAGDFATEIADIRNALFYQGWTQYPTNGTLIDALEAGVPVSTIIDHFGKVIAKGIPQGTHMVNILRLDASLYPYLLDGTGVGYVPWLATPEEQRALFGYTQADVDAAAGALRALDPPMELVDYVAYRDSGGVLGCRPLGTDPRDQVHNSSDARMARGEQP